MRWVRWVRWVFEPDRDEHRKIIAGITADRAKRGRIHAGHRAPIGMRARRADERGPRDQQERGARDLQPAGKVAQPVAEADRGEHLSPVPIGEFLAPERQKEQAHRYARHPRPYEIDAVGRSFGWQLEHRCHCSSFMHVAMALRMIHL